MTELTLTTDPPQGGGVVVHATGELDLHAAANLYNHIGNLLTRHRLVFLDLSQVTFCDSTGYNALIRLHRRAHEARSQFILVSPHPTVSRLLALTAAVDVFDVYDNQADAYAAHPVGHDD